MSAGLRVTRQPNETWRECVRRIASKHGLEIECLEAFDEYIFGKEEESRAAWCALYDWDCLDVVEVK